MNIFVTNKCPKLSAQDHCDIHLRKMIVECCQLLSTAHYELDGVIVGYKPTHKNHPCSIWVRKNSSNYEWAYNHLVALCNEYTRRFGKVHKTQGMINSVKRLPFNIPKSSLSCFPMAMPDEFKKLGVFDQTKAYKVYLNKKAKSVQNAEG